jgi:hypothetical protein
MAGGLAGILLEAYKPRSGSRSFLTDTNQLQAIELAPAPIHVPLFSTGSLRSVGVRLGPASAARAFDCEPAERPNEASPGAIRWSGTFRSTAEPLSASRSSGWDRSTVGQLGGPSGTPIPFGATGHFHILRQPLSSVGSLRPFPALECGLCHRWYAPLQLW